MKLSRQKATSSNSLTLYYCHQFQLLYVHLHLIIIFLIM